MSGISPVLLGSAVLIGAVLLVVVTLGALGSLVLVAKSLIQLQSEALGALKVLIADISQARSRQDGHQSAIMAELLAPRPSQRPGTYKPRLASWGITLITNRHSRADSRLQGRPWNQFRKATLDLTSVRIS